MPDKKKSTKVLKISAACVIFLILHAQESWAASCADLTRQIGQLRSASSSAGNKWDAAAKRQAQALGMAQRDARYFSCGAANAQTACAALIPKIARMKQNLESLQRQSRKAGGAGRNQRRLAKLERAYNRKACASQKQTRTAAAPTVRYANSRGDGRPLLPQSQDNIIAPHGASPPSQASQRQRELDLFLARPRKENAPRRASSSTSPSYSQAHYDYNDGLVSSRFGRGNYRTVCVRTCDGFFFPVSFSVKKEAFSRDEAVCRSMCPAADVRLFVHRNPGETVENLMALDGARYDEEPNANLFRTKYVDGCSCSGDPGERQTMTSLIRSDEDAAAGYLRSRSLEPLNGDGAAAPNLRESIDVAAFKAPAGADPDSKMNALLGYNPNLEQSNGSFEVLTRRKRLPATSSTRPEAQTHEEEDISHGETAEEDNSPAVKKKKPVRVVGPEYYLGQ